jgi:DNA-directed RNA polymerase subunit RPC12/RpoP
MALHEREFFNEKPESKPATLTCPKCRHRDEYQVRWIRRTKKDRLPPGADERDRALFGKLRDYLIRVDDAVVCLRCQRKFEIPSHQSLVFL